MTRPDMTIKIEAGRYYRTRDGRKVGPMRKLTPRDCFAAEWRFTDSAAGEIPPEKRAWREDGSECFLAGRESASDLIAEWADTPDLTAIEKPFGLLDAATQQALRNSGGPWERYDGEWALCPAPAWGREPAWAPGTAYRLAPRPAPVTRDMWLHEDGTIVRDDEFDGDKGWTPVRVTFVPGDPASYRVEGRE